MKRKLKRQGILFVILVLLVLSCSPAVVISTPVDDSATVSVQIDRSPTLPSATDSPTSTTIPPTLPPTATIYPPVFNPEAIGDNRVLESFILERFETIRNGSDDGDWWDTIGYIKDPAAAFHTGRFAFSGETHVTDSYFLLDGLLYTKDGQNDPPWYYYVHFLPDPDEVDFWLLGAADMREGDIIRSRLVESAQFVGEEDYQGVPAFHFIVDETNISKKEANFTGVVTDAQGDLYLAQEGSYLLYFYLKMSGSEGTRELKEELTSINQLTEVSLPSDFPVFEFDSRLPFPDGAILWSVQTDEARDYDSYNFFVPTTVSYDQFLHFYRTLPLTNGWSLVSIGGIPDYYYCQSRDCVTLNNGSTRVILYQSDLCVSTMPAGYACYWADYFR